MGGVKKLRFIYKYLYYLIKSDKSIEGGIPKIIPTDQFGMVQNILHNRKNKNASMRGQRTYLLTGKIICGECGSSYVGNSKRSGRNKKLQVTIVVIKDQAKQAVNAIIKR